MTIKDDESIELQTPFGAMRTYVFRPVAEGRYPGLVLFSEIFQVTGPIRRSAALLAGHGFIVAVPEIFHELEEPGTVLPYDQAGADRGNCRQDWQRTVQLRRGCAGHAQLFNEAPEMHWQAGCHRFLHRGPSFVSGQP